MGRALDLAKSIRPNSKMVLLSILGLLECQMSDYTKNKDPERKKAYLARHRANENWKNKESAGFWSRYLLWEKPSLREAAKALRSKGLNVTLQG